MARINISQILMKRGNTAAAGNYIGPLGELVVDTGLRTIRVQDGVTAGGLVSYYLNGQPAGTNTGVTFIQYGGNNGEYVALCDNYWYGDIGVCAVYGRTLSGDEIKQNYNAIKSRYGL